MGTLAYGSSGGRLYVEDRALSHLKIVMATKLRRNESFTLSWRQFDGSGRETLWIHPSIPLRFTFEEVDAPSLNVRWIEEMMYSANSTGGIVLTEENIAA
ncbi:hypothetical protein ACI3KS_07270 [Microbacterium sp. ZW T5_45]|uniref:DUF7882 family protein n=1 Tax=Microbacterium sp. ZW T5_45 TaxID=3378080 RepID=UPI00385523AF